MTSHFYRSNHQHHAATYLTMNSLLTKTILTFALFATVAESATADIPNLGVISQKHAVLLTNECSRADFAGFYVEFKPTGNSNVFLVVLPKSADVLTLEHLSQVPSGTGVLGVQCAYENGDRSEVALFRYDLRRSTPAKPSARLIEVLGASEGEKGLTNEIRKIRERRVTPTPPWPTEFTSGLDAPVPKRQQIVDRPTALPNGTNLSYFQFLDRLADSAGWGRRRSQ